MMFHVKHLESSAIICVILTFITFSCGAIRTYQIEDHEIFPNGIPVDNIAMNAYVFENNQRNVPFLYFLAAKFDKGNVNSRDQDINIDGIKCRMHIYDDAEFDKYFKLSNFSMINEIPENGRIGDNQRFVAISVIGDNNEDMLSPKSLFHKVTIDYLSRIKKEYFKR